MNYSYIIPDDVVNGCGICVSLFTQGCPHHCPGCFNQELWTFEGGKPFTQKTVDEIIKLITKNGIKRNFSILGGEPLCDENKCGVAWIIMELRKVYPDIKIWIWTGYTMEEL